MCRFKDTNTCRVPVSVYKGTSNVPGSIFAVAKEDRSCGSTYEELKSDSDELIPAPPENACCTPLFPLFTAGVQQAARWEPTDGGTRDGARTERGR